jgi:hypothetical protein
VRCLRQQQDRVRGFGQERYLVGCQHWKFHLQVQRPVASVVPMLSPISLRIAPDDLRSTTCVQSARHAATFRRRCRRRSGKDRTLTTCVAVDLGQHCTGHTSKVNAVRFNKEASVIISSSYDASVKCWDTRSKNRNAIMTLDEAGDVFDVLLE